MPDLQESGTEKTWQDRMREHYGNCGNIARFFEDIILYKELAPNLSPSNLASIYCFLEILHEYPYLLDDVDPDALEGADDFLQELMQRMEYVGNTK